MTAGAMTSMWLHYSSTHRAHAIVERAAQHFVLVVIHSFLPLLLYHARLTASDDHSFNVSLALVVLFCMLDMLTVSNLWATSIGEHGDYRMLRLFE